MTRFTKSDAIPQINRMMEGYARSIANLEGMLTDPATPPADQATLDNTLRYAQASWNAMAMALAAFERIPEDMELMLTAEDVRDATMAAASVITDPTEPELPGVN